MGTLHLGPSHQRAHVFGVLHLPPKFGVDEGVIGLVQVQVAPIPLLTTELDAGLLLEHGFIIGSLQEKLCQGGQSCCQHVTADAISAESCLHHFQHPRRPRGQLQPSGPAKAGPQPSGRPCWGLPGRQLRLLCNGIAVAGLSAGAHLSDIVGAVLLVVLSEVLDAFIEACKGLVSHLQGGNVFLASLVLVTIDLNLQQRVGYGTHTHTHTSVASPRV